MQVNIKWLQSLRKIPIIKVHLQKKYFIFHKQITLGRKTKLIAGITAKAELLIREAKDVFVVPSSALFDDGEVTYIAIVQDMKVKRIPVTMGVDGDVVVEVIPTDGTVLEEGMQVITNPGPHLMDGAAVLITQ